MNTHDDGAAAERELAIARQIQMEFLPKQLPHHDGWELASRFRPARTVGGDFLDAFSLANGKRLGLVVADVCDKGVGAALFMALFRSLIRAYAQQHYGVSWTAVLDNPGPREGPRRTGRSRRMAHLSPGTVALSNAIALTNRYIVENHPDTGMFATVFFGVLDPQTGELNYINAGHTPALVVGPGGLKERLEATGPAIGVLPDVDHQVRSTRLEPRDVLLAYTDGVTEAENPRGELFSEERLVALTVNALAAGFSPSAETVARQVEDTLTAFAGSGDLSDDMTLLVVRRVEES